MAKFNIEQPCNRICSVGWCSLACFLMRGYMRGPDAKWLRDDDGRIMMENNPACDWEPHERTPEEEQEWRDYCAAWDREHEQEGKT